MEGLVLGPLKRGSFGHQMGSLNLISCDEPGDCHPVFLRRLGKLTLKCWKQVIYLQRKQVFFPEMIMEGQEQRWERWSRPVEGSGPRADSG